MTLRHVPAAGAARGGPPVPAAAPQAAPAEATFQARTERSRPRRRRAWAELLRLPALFSVPGDALAGAAAAGAVPNARTLLAIGSSLCLYEAGMALNDWADRDVDAVERPHRPLPSGRVRPAAALTAACLLTGAGLALAARAGRPALAVAAPLAATVWAYDLGLKHTPAGPVAMGAARGLDLLLGAAATIGRTRPAAPSAALLGTHTLAVTTVSRQEAQGGSPLAPLAALATTALLTRRTAYRPAPPIRDPARATGHEPRPEPAGRPGHRGPAAPLTTAPPGHPARQSPAAPLTTAPTGHPARSGPVAPPTAAPTGQPGRPEPAGLLATALAAAYAVSTARPYVHAALNPSPPLTQRAVGAGIRATVPLQAALAARAGRPVPAVLIAALAPLGARFAKKVSIT
ncbi:SCO3242 family prenyltransferase [Streptomyces sp. NPDC003456]|uniref:SCO3242 family prenyltransferase n=1 Tax=Streptomyces sp. NPDC003456 TaxID=3364683 RepID=UPI003683EC96